MRHRNMPGHFSYCPRPLRRHGAKGYRSVRLSVGQALPIERYSCAQLLLLYFSACRGSLPRRRTNAGCINFLGYASKLIYEEGVYSSPEISYLYWLLLWKICLKNLRTIFESSSSNTLVLFTGKALRFLRFFCAEISWSFFPSEISSLKEVSTYGEGILPNGLGRRYIHSRFILTTTIKEEHVRCAVVVTKFYILWINSPS